MQRAPTQWIICAVIVLALFFVTMPSSEADGERGGKWRSQLASHDPNHGHHEHEDHAHQAEEKYRQEAQRKAAEEQVRAQLEAEAPAEEEKPAKPAAQHDDHQGHGGHDHEGQGKKEETAEGEGKAPADEEPEIPNVHPHNVDHGHGEDILFRMPSPGVRRDLLEVEINPKQGFFGGEKIPSNDHHNPRSVMWQAPPVPAVGVLLLYHGCNHDGSDWFTGPAERRIVAHALANGIVPIAMQAGQRHGAKCWHNDWPVVINSDVIAMKSVMEHFFQHSTRRAWAKLPLYALGASSGGVFATIFARVWKFNAITVAVAPGLKEAFVYNTALRRIPATAFVYMKGDTTWASKIVIDTQVEKLRERRLEAQSFEQTPKAITAELLSEYLDLPKDKIQRVHNLMQKLNMIDHAGQLKGDPRALGVGEKIAQTLKQEEPDFAWDQHVYGLQQVANIAEGVHEIAFERWPEALAWMRARGQEADD